MANCTFRHGPPTHPAFAPPPLESLPPASDLLRTAATGDGTTDRHGYDAHGDSWQGPDVTTDDLLAARQARTPKPTGLPTAVERDIVRTTRHASQREILQRFAGTEAEPFLRALVCTLNGETTTRWFLEDELAAARQAHAAAEAAVQRLIRSRLETWLADGDAAPRDPHAAQPARIGGTEAP